MSHMGELTYFLSLQIKQMNDRIFISQYKYAKELLKRFGMNNFGHKNTPMSTTTFLDKDENGKNIDQKLYRGMIGSLLYITSSRPDIMFSVCLCYVLDINQILRNHILKQWKGFFGILITQSIMAYFI